MEWVMQPIVMAMAMEKVDIMAMGCCVHTLTATESKID